MQVFMGLTGLFPGLRGQKNEIFAGARCLNDACDQDCSAATVCIESGKHALSLLAVPYLHRCHCQILWRNDFKTKLKQMKGYRYKE